MWTTEEVIISLKYDKVPKWQLIQYLKLEKVWNRYNREEFAQIVSEEANNNIELSQLLSKRREQRLAKKELDEIYFKDLNTLPPCLQDGVVITDWVHQLQEYKQKRYI